MNQKKIVFLLLICFSFHNCNKSPDIYELCKIDTKNLSEEEYIATTKSWFECLVSERLKEKSKLELLKDLSGDKIEGAFTGIEGKLSDSYLSGQALSRILTDEELRVNIHSNEPGIKYHSFLTIANKKDDDVFDILKTFLDDSTKVTTFFGCVINETTIADLFIDIVTEKYYHSYEGYEPSNYQLTREEKEELDAIVTNSSLNLHYKNKL